MGKRYNIALIEIDYHTEVLLNLADIFANIDFNVHIFCSRKIFEQIPYSLKEKYTIHTPENNEKLPSFFERSQQELNEFDLIFFTTLASKFKFFSHYELKPKKILLIHNANIYLNPLRSFGTLLDLESIKNFLYYFFIHTLGKLDIIYRYKFLRNVEYICFPGLEIYDYVDKQKLGYSNIDILPLLPLVLSKPNLSVYDDRETKIYITIIGRIEKSRKDFSEVYKAFRSIANSITNPVEITLLGNPVRSYGRRIISKFNSIKNDKFSVKSYSEYVDQDEFDRVISKTDFLIVPVAGKTQFRDHIEIYGKSKITGNLNDLILHEKPAIVPSRYPLKYPLNLISSQYSDVDELSSILLNWINKKEYSELYKNLGELKKFYSRDNVLDKFRNTITPLFEEKD